MVFGLVVALALYLYHMKSLSLLSFHVLLVCNLMLVIVVPMTVINNSRSGKPNWSAIAALAVWLLSNRRDARQRCEKPCSGAEPYHPHEAKQQRRGGGLRV